MKPNVLLIVCDEMRPFELGCYGGDTDMSPYIDRLASESYVFETAVTPNPVCTPARSCLLSGMYSRSASGNLFNCDAPACERTAFPEKTMAEAFSEAGYDTVLTGKWHIPVHPETLGFHTAVFPKAHHLNSGQLYFRDGESFTVPGYAPDFELELTKNELNKKRERPFFIYHNISLPHAPSFDVPERFRNKFDPRKTALRANAFLDESEDNARAFKVYLYDYLHYMGGDVRYDVLPDGFDLHSLSALYKGMISAADEQVGTLLDMLEESGRSEDTIVAFLSDHGDTLGSHGRFFKENLWEETVRVPMMVRYGKNFSPAHDLKTVASLIDIAPTLLSLAEIQVPRRMEGIDLSNLMINGVSPARDRVFIECTNRELAVRSGDCLYSVLTDWPDGEQYNQFVTDARYRFYDLEQDPYQMTNHAKSNYKADIAADLRESVLEFQKKPWFRPNERRLHVGEK